MSWLASLRTAGESILSFLRLSTRAAYVLSTYLYAILLPPPLRWALYKIYALVLFLLSPIRLLFSTALGAVSLSINLIARLKLACAAIIGVCAGFILHTTSSFIFALFGLDTVPKRRELIEKLDRGQLSTPPYSPDEETDRAYDYVSSSGPSGQHLDTGKAIARVHPNDLFEERWRQIQMSEQPRRRRKGLLGQTIHEESSESDLS
ncbi:hypothetical protein GGR50DRAFT_498676 [Xylaria sp. CBS 124048]|nr:hypothetical protein GGR50DRAFT_498676 [Xylaria sp. CBS 124048]